MCFDVDLCILRKTEATTCLLYLQLYPICTYMYSDSGIQHLPQSASLTLADPSAGLEALRNDHNSILNGLMGSMKATEERSELVEEKAGLIQKSLDTIELGLGEAQVRTR